LHQRNMKRILVLPIILALLVVSCLTQQTKIPPIVPESTDSIPEPPDIKTQKKSPQYKLSVEENLKSYFYGREIVPSIIVNNTERDQTKIQLENNKVEWIRNEKETKIKINEDLFTLKDKKTINSLELSPLEKHDDYEAVDFADNWEQIKFYKFDDRQLIGISMGNEPCTGIGCSVAFQLIYDLKTKSKTFFGTYRIEREVNLYDFKNDGTIDYLGKTYIGESDGVAKEISNVYKLYSMDEKGVFHQQFNNKQKPYFINRTFEAENYREIESKFEASWLEEIK